ncbi:MAG TPA: hypothetical protein VGF44_10020 [Terriglobales bacterium]
MFPRKSWARKAAHVFVCLLVFFCAYVFPAAADNSIIGSWKFVSDSDGATADNGVTVTLSFNLSGVAFSAVGPGQNISGNGSYSTSGSNVTINLPSLGKSANNQSFSINVNTLILPFEVFSDGPGTSTWFRVISPGGGSNGTSNPPPQNPPTNPNDPNNPTNPNNPDNPNQPNNPIPNNPNQNPDNPNPGNSNPPDNPPTPPNPPNPPNPQNPPLPNPNPNQPNPNDPNNPNSPRAPKPEPVNPAFEPYVGDWVGNGWSWETRFHQSRKDFTNQLFHGIPDQMTDRNNIQGNVMEVMVEHETEYEFTVDEHGHIEGQGEIVYSVYPNLCGLAVLTKQVNEAVNMMKYISTVYKLANEIGTGVLHSFNKEWMEKENELNTSLESLAEVETRIAPEGGRYAASTGKGEEEVEKDVTKALEDLGAKPGTRRLAYDEILSRCTSSTNYEIAGGLPCDLVTNPVAETELKSAAGAAAKGFGELTEDKFWEKLIEEGKERMNELNGIEKEADTACLATGPTNKEELYDLIKEKFNEAYAKEAKGGGIGGAAVTFAKGIGSTAGGIAEGMDPTEMVNLMLSVPGVTQVTYAYKALPNGPEARRFRMSGYLVPSTSGGTPTMHLSMNTDDVSGGKKNLEVDYMVNYKWSQGFFPIWTPFPDKPGQVKPSGTVTLPKQTWGDGEGEGEGEEGAPEPPTSLTMKTPFAMYHDTGAHRNGVVPWQEYEYFWFAHKVTEPAGTAASETKSAKGPAKEE